MFTTYYSDERGDERDHGDDDDDNDDNDDMIVNVVYSINVNM